MATLITSIFIAIFFSYIGAWYIGSIEGNFSLLLFCACVVTGVYWLAEKLVFLPRRRKLHEQLYKMSGQDDGEASKSAAQVLAQPWWLEWTAGLFPVILIVFLIRSFLFEPFKIPSGSMMPTLVAGDLILVNKFHYGLRMPLLDTKITTGNLLSRGDTVVFRYPPQPSQNYIKRVIGLPGDQVAWLNKRLFINGQEMPMYALPEYHDVASNQYFLQYEETLDALNGKTKHRLLLDDSAPAFVSEIQGFNFSKECKYMNEGIVCQVPPGKYFMMGDNRDNSLDSRFWGFVPEANIVGKAVFIWMNFTNPQRIGSIK